MLVRAAVLEEVGRPAVVRELELIEPRAGEVRVRMLASGVCHSDLHVRDGEWDRPTPIVMGHEGAGVVEAVGPGVTTPRVGQLVALSWLIPCGICRSCRRGQVWACPDSPSYRHTLLDGEVAFRSSRPPPPPAYGVIPLENETADAIPPGNDAIASNGEPPPSAARNEPAIGTTDSIRSYCAIATMAEASVVPAVAAIPIPDGVDPAAAALVGCCVTTGVGAVLKTAQVPAGASVAVIGLGGVGLSCVMGAVVAGASRIVAIDRMAAKLDAARAVGATDTVLAGDEPSATLDAVRDLTDGGPDYVFEAIGRASTAELAVEMLPVGGAAVLVGMTPIGDRASFEVYPFVDGSRRILGSNYGFADPSVDFPRYAGWILDGRLPVERLIDRRIGLDDVEGAFDAMREGRFVRQVIAF